jgi:hypothetical protein
LPLIRSFKACRILTQAILGHLDPDFASLPDEDKPHVIDTLQCHALTRPDLVSPPAVPKPKMNMRMSPLGKGYEGPGAHDIPGSFEGHPENIGEWTEFQIDDEEWDFYDALTRYVESPPPARSI